VNQHSTHGDLQNLQDAILHAKNGTLVVLGADATMEPGDPDTYGPFARIWCLVGDAWGWW
jgi:hypothetical protein